MVDAADGLETTRDHTGTAFGGSQGSYSNGGMRFPLGCHPDAFPRGEAPLVEKCRLAGPAAVAGPHRDHTGATLRRPNSVLF
jgi:hypothetical protein